MHIKHLHIKNFRGIKDFEVDLHKTLNVFIGENNSGKSTILDAIRICLNYGKFPNDFYVKKSDFHLPGNDQPVEQIELHFTFEKDVDEDLAFISLLGIDENENEILKAHFVYTLIEKNGLTKIKSKVWGGGLDENPLSSEEFSDHVFSVYLDALRDAESSLRPGRSSKTGELFLKLEPNLEKQKKLAEEIQTALASSEEWNLLIKKGDEAILEHLSGITLKNNPLKIDLKFLPTEFKKTVSTLLLETLHIKDQTKKVVLDLQQNGLGLNNLIYSAVILSDIQSFKKQENVSLAALLIEEPEAHLHPQQQNLFFQYLSDVSTKSTFQTFITSHSPTITAKVPLPSIKCIKKKADIVKCFNPINVLDEPSQVYLHKFLDSTKSHLFFSNGTMLVEGISEALLMPVFAKKLGYDFDKNGVEVVNIGGVAFSHFAKLYNSKDEFNRLNSKCSLLTDDDQEVESEEISSRALKAKALEEGNLKVFLAFKTFEVELFMAGSNKEILLKLWKLMHPKSIVSESTDEKQYAINFLAKVEANKAKSDLAYQLVKILEEDQETFKKFEIPTYIRNSIKWVCDG